MGYLEQISLAWGQDESVGDGIVLRNEQLGLFSSGEFELRLPVSVGAVSLSSCVVNVDGTKDIVGVDVAIGVLGLFSDSKHGDVKHNFSGTGGGEVHLVPIEVVFSVTEDNGTVIVIIVTSG